MYKKNIVILGGANGTGLNVRGLKMYDDLHVTAIVSMSDSGRTAGKIREEIGELPPADILRVLISASNYDYYFLREFLYKKRFTHPSKIEGLNIGSLLISLTSRYIGNMIPVIENIHYILDCNATVLPATLQMTDLHVELSNGRHIHGEGYIDEPIEEIPDGVVVQKAWLEPNGDMYYQSKQALEQADVIIIGPGDLYTSNIPPLLTIGAQQAIKTSSAKLVYVAGNKYTIGGEPAPKSLSERTFALEQYLPRPIDLVMYDTHQITSDEQITYDTKRWGLINFDIERLSDKVVVGADIERSGGGIDPEKLGIELYHYIQTLE